MANEASKVLQVVSPIVSTGVGLDLGCGPYKVSPNAVGIDEGRYDGVVNSKVLDHIDRVPTHSQDWVFSSHYLEHEPDWILVLDAVHRVLKPGGDLLLYLPDVSVYKNAAGQDPNSTHVNHWTKETFVAALSRKFGHRYEIIDAHSRNTTPPGHAFTGNGHTEDPRAGGWEYSFFIHARKPAK